MSRTLIRAFALLSFMALAATACNQANPDSRSTPDADASSVTWPEFRGDPATVREAVSGWVEKGDDAIPRLKEGIHDEDAQVRRACREALAKITGQWGWDEGLQWRRSMAEATSEASATGKPIMLLQLFGKFDEEFC